MPEANTPAPPEESPLRSKGVLLEAAVILGVMLVPTLIRPALRGPLAFLPLAYLLIERRARRRPWSDLGVRLHGFRAALARNRYLVLTAVAIQPISLFAARAWWPAWLEHVQNRVPVPEVGGFALLFALLPVAVFIEELTYRGLFQQRVAWFTGAPVGIAVAALAFGLMHLHSGAPAVVAFDVGMVVVDGVLYGVIFARGENIYVPWLAHLVGDLCGIACLMSL
jgi:membrane protease YdiL (CAAX protease family)